jgi:hypothetical protein
MPPKKEVISKKIIEDKTFGLKNKKKSKKVQAFVAEVSKQAKRNVDNMFDKAKSDDAKRQAELRKAKEAQAAIEKEMSALLRASVKQPKVRLSFAALLGCRLWTSPRPKAVGWRNPSEHQLQMLGSGSEGVLWCSTRASAASSTRQLACGRSTGFPVLRLHSPPACELCSGAAGLISGLRSLYGSHSCSCASGGCACPRILQLEPGVDPKSVLCEFFKAGCCEKGDK